MLSRTNGPIPVRAGWPNAELREVTHFVSRGTAPVYVDESPVRAIGQRCVTQAGFSAKFARPHDSRRMRNALRPERGDVLVNSTGTGTIGRSCLFDQPGDYVVDSHVTVIRPNPVSADGRWIDSLLRTVWGQRYLETHCYSGSTNQVELATSKLARMSIPLPTFPEQRRIAKVLDSVDDSIQVTGCVLSKGERLCVGLAEALLRPRDGWKRVQLAELVDGRPKNGYSPKEVDYYTGTVILGLGCLTPNGFMPHQLKNAPVQDRGLHRALLSDGDLLMSRSNTRDLVGLVGRFQDIGMPCVYPDLMMRIAPKAIVRPRFLEVILRSHPVRKQIQAQAVGTSGSMVKINSNTVMQLDVAVPDAEEQDRILRRLSVADASLDATRKELAKLRELKRGLMEDLLTGLVRVSDAEKVVETVM